jgi:thiol reductant ABC exporter CydC subunit
VHSGDLLNRIAVDVEALEGLFVRVLAPPMVAAIIAISVTLLAGAIAPTLGFLLLTSMAVVGLGLPWLAHYLSFTDGRAMSATRTELNQALVDTIQGASDLIALGRASSQQARIEALGHRYLDLQRRMGSVSALTGSISGLVLNLTVVGLLIIAIPLVRTARLDGVLLGVLILAATSSFEAVLPLPVAFQYLETTLASGRRIFEIIDQKPAVSDPLNPADLSAPPTIETHRLSFFYEQGTAPALDELTLTVPAYGRVALVGPSGAGKSTLINLLLRFWDYHSGSVKLGGVELRELSQEEIRRAISVVSQSTYLFTATIRDNLLLARPDATEDAIVAAARQARIHNRIVSFPDGYDTWIGERGLQLSGGERQRLAVARAILKGAPILLLDEPTANLDAISERRVLQQLEELTRSKTTLLVTHRLVGMESMDQIVVLRHGRVVEQGSHLDLMSAGGFYARMWCLQLTSMDTAQPTSSPHPAR